VPVDGDAGCAETATVPNTHHAVGRFPRAWFARRVVIPLAHAFAHYSRARVFGDNLIPSDGPVIYVGKHPRSYLYLETALLGVFAFWDSGRPPFRVLESAHASTQRAPLHSWIRHHVGAIPAIEESALEVLRNGESLLIFPGGTRELYGAPDQLRWHGREGYARLAVTAQVPVIPFAIAGADQQHPMRISVGRSSIWLPPIPLPVPLDFYFGAPLLPPVEPVDGEIRGVISAYAAQVHAATTGLLAAAVAERRKRV
jgi:1-acyl-sn-glycerol-3-phosphate acyltransferase